MTRKTDHRRVWAYAAVSLTVALRGFSISPVYEIEDVDIRPDAVTCRRTGTETMAADALSRQAFWTDKNYEGQLGVAHVEGKGFCLTGASKMCDTAWHTHSQTVPLKGGCPRYRLAFRVDSTITINDMGKDGETWSSFIHWFGADGAKLSSTPVYYTALKRRRTDIALYGDIPKGAAAYVVQLGFDRPNITPDNHVTYSALSFEELADSPAFAKRARCASEIHTGGALSWRADLPAGCAVRFQWRGAESADGLAEKPFRGPDGTEASFYDAPFTADAPVIQYRVTLCSDGAATPALLSVTVGQVTDRDWTIECNIPPPRIRRISPSPTRDTAAPLRIAIENATEAVILWKTLTVKVDGADRTAAVRRADNVISLAAPDGGWGEGLHVAEVHVVDFHGNTAAGKKMFFIGDAPTTAKVSLRDDGITLIDGKPFFPIGLYAVCKREFNGNSFDNAFKGLKEAGFNLGHTYGNAYDPEFLAAAVKYDIKLWVAARFPEENLINTGRHNPSIIAWYLGDDTADHIPPELEADYDEAVKAVDPTRITVQADPIGSGPKTRYSDYVTATDGFLPEIYPVRNQAGDISDTTCVADVIRDMALFHSDVKQYGKGQPHTCWAIIQYFKGWSGWKHFPTREQLFAMSFAAVIHGAHGLTWYTYGGFKENEGVTSTPERWQNICDLAGRLSALEPVLVERTPPQPSPPEALTGPKTDPHGTPSVTCLLKKHDGFSYLLTVNAATEPVTAKLTVPGAETAEVLYENRTCPCDHGTLTDTFAPFAVHIYRWKGGN